MTKFLDLFEKIEKGNFGLTDAMIYQSIQMGSDFIPIWGGNQDHSIPTRYVEVHARTTENKRITIFKGEGIIISFDGSSGSMTYKKSQRFALNHHAGFFKVKTGAKKQINPKFFALFYQKQLQEASISEGSRTLTVKQIYSMDFEIPEFSTQNEIMEKVGPLLKKRQKLIEMNNKIDAIFSKHIV